MAPDAQLKNFWSFTWTLSFSTELSMDKANKAEALVNQ